MGQLSHGTAVVWDSCPVMLSCCPAAGLPPLPVTGHTACCHVCGFVEAPTLAGHASPPPRSAEAAVIAALLHDVLDDTDVAAAEVEALFGEQVRAALPGARAGRVWGGGGQVERSCCWQVG